MKKKPFFLLFLILSFLSHPCFARMWTGFHIGFVPQIYPGATYIASNDAYAAVYQDFVSSDSLEYSYSALGYEAGGFFEYDFLDNLGVRLDFSIKFLQGFKSVISSSYTDTNYYRTFTSYEIVPYVKYYPFQNSFLFFGLLAGPKFSFTVDKSVDGWSSITVTSGRIQKFFLPGFSAGADFGICIFNNLYYTCTVLFEGDFVKTFDSEKTSEWFSKIVGNRLDFSINFGLILKI